VADFNTLLDFVDRMNSAHESMELMYVFDDLKSIFGLESHRGGMSDVVELIKNKYNAAKK